MVKIQPSAKINNVDSLCFQNQGQSCDTVYGWKDNQYSNGLTARRRIMHLSPDKRGRYRWKILKLSRVGLGCKWKKTTHWRWKVEQQNNVSVLQKRRKDKSCSLISMKRLQAEQDLQMLGQDFQFAWEPCANPSAQPPSVGLLSWAGTLASRREHTARSAEELITEHWTFTPECWITGLQRLKKKKQKVI